MSDCLFCSISPERIIAKNELVYAIRDGFPVTPLHTLVIPFRHVIDFFGLTFDELRATQELLLRVKANIILFDPTVEGFNIGMNAGEVAGQTIFHCHTHLIPRRKGDVGQPPRPEGRGLQQPSPFKVSPNQLKRLAWVTSNGEWLDKTTC